MRYGRPAAEALRSRIAAAKSGDPLSPVTIVVPSNHVGVATRRLLASGELGPLSSHGHGIAAASFLTVYRLADLLGAARLAGKGRRPVSTPVIAAALRAALEEDPGIFAPVAGHPATEAALVDAYRELREVSEPALRRLASMSQRAKDVVRLHQAARDRLVVQFYDEEDLVGAAAELLAADEKTRDNLGTVIVFLPQRLSLHGADLIARIAEHTEVHVLAGTTDDARADGEVRRSVCRLRVDHPGPLDAGALAPSGHTRIVSTSDADEEVRTAVRKVVDSVQAGVPLERIAVLYGSREPYARLVHEQLSAAGIAHNGAATIPLTSRMAGRCLLGLLDLPASGFRRAAVFSWLTGTRLFYKGRPIPVAPWERLSRTAGVVAGRDDWDRLLASCASDADAEAERCEADPDAPEWRAQASRREAERARDLRQWVLALIDDSDDMSRTKRRWVEHVGWARRHLHALGGDRERARWPLVEQKAAERTERALGRLACLDAVEGPVDIEVFTRTLRLELEVDLGRVGRMGEGALVGAVTMGIGLDLDLVVVLGLAEGSFPAAVRDDSLLPDAEREATEGELSLKADETEHQHHDLLAALAGAKQRILCVPRGDLRRSSEQIPSRWLTAMASSLAGRPLVGTELSVLDAAWLEHVPSFEAGLCRAAFPATEQEHRLCVLLGQALPRWRTGQLAGALTAALGDPKFSKGVEMVSARRSDRFTRFDGNLRGLGVPSPAGSVTSATRLEGWAVCPFAYLLKEILHVEPVENPEDRLQISPVDAGSLVHKVLELFIDSVLALPSSDQPSPEQAWCEADMGRLIEMAGEIFDCYERHGLVGRSLFWKRDRRRIMADLLRFLREDSAHRARNGTRPIAAELAFGLPGAELGAVELRLSDGRSVHFRGKADRLDAAADGGLEIIDYKTGKADGYTGLSEEAPDLGGTKLQLAVYALAARAHLGRPDALVLSQYWFTSARGGFKHVGYVVTADVLERVGATVAQMAAGIEAGVFPHYPAAASTTPFVECPYCDPDGLGVVDIRRAIERKKDGDPALSAFFDLAGAKSVFEPGAGEPEDG